MKISDVEGIGPVYADKLCSAGVLTTEKLLEAGSTPKGRKALAATVGISEKLILEWVNHADLYRVRGIGSEYADLLEAAGVDTVPELANRNPENLFKKLQEVNAEKNLVRRLPPLSFVQTWIASAKELPRVIEY